MTQYLTSARSRGIAEYARIGLSGEELSEMTVDLNNIIETLQSIKQLDLEGVELRSIPSEACPTSCARTWKPNRSRSRLRLRTRRSSRTAAS